MCLSPRFGSSKYPGFLYIAAFYHSNRNPKIKEGRRRREDRRERMGVEGEEGGRGEAGREDRRMMHVST